MTLPHTRHEDDVVVDALRDLARTEALVETPPHVEAKVMAAWDAAHAAPTPLFFRRSRVRAAGRQVAWRAAAVAAAVLLATAFSVQRIARDAQQIPALPAAPDWMFASSAEQARVDAPDPPSVPARPTIAARTSDAPAIVYIGDAVAGGEPMRVVRMRVAASKLAQFGIRSAAQQTGSVDLELLVGEDGVARGLRMVM